MQQKLVLYIGNVTVYSEAERVDQFKDETVSFTQTIQNVKDIKKIFTEFTKTFSLPASKKNNKIFKHYYNFDIDNGFDARKKVNAALELNDIPYKTGKIALTGVDLKNNVPHTYKVTFYGNTVDLKDILGDSQLSSLTSLSEGRELFYSYSNMIRRLESEDDDIIAPLITHTDRMTYNSLSSAQDYGNIYAHSGTSANGINWNQFKYAIRVQAIIDAIQTTFPSIVFSTDYFNNTSNTDFYNLYMWLHRNKGDVIVPTLGQANWTTLTEIRQTSATLPISAIAYADEGGLRINANLVEPDFFEVSLTVTASTAGAYDIIVRRDSGEIIVQMNDESLTTNVLVDASLEDNRTYTIEIRSTTALTFAADSIIWTVDFTQRDDNGQSAVGQQVFKNEFVFQTNTNLEFNIAQQIPKMKIIDFLSGLFQMFNLTAYVNDTGTIVVKTLDNYYNWNFNPSGINIDEYLDVSKSSVDIALPFKSVNFSYKGLGTILAKKYEQEFNSGWGSLSYSLNNDIYDALEEAYKIELPFEHLMYERLYDTGEAIPTNFATDVQWGYFVDDNQEPYFGSPLLFYPIHITGGDAIRILDTPTVDNEDITDYFIPSNSLSLVKTTSEVTIHFGEEINEYLANEPSTSPGSSTFSDGLFETKYKTYIQNVFNNSRRLTTVTAYLPYKIFSKLELNDVIQIRQNSYWINSMTTDLTTGKTKFELLNKLRGITQQ
mgnify:CR=1 FL=1